MLHRIAMIPLYIDPETYKKQYLFHLNVEESQEIPIMSVTASDFRIYPLKDTVIPEEITEMKLTDYDMNKPLSEEDKSKIFRPFSFQGKDSYCIITELRKTGSSQKQVFELYGVPSVSFGYEDARWQSVSRASYYFKKDEELFASVLQEKISIQNIKPEDQEKFHKSLSISESERYFHRDLTMEPYWYSFTIDSVHQLPPKELFSKACELLREQFTIIKEELKKLPTGKESIIGLQLKQLNVYHITIHGYDDTIGNIIQTQIVNKKIKEGSSISVCGYKRIHPLEERIKFIVSLDMDHPVSQLSEPQKVDEIIKVFSETCDELDQIYQDIIEAANQSM